MITIFNRKEVAFVNTMERQVKIQDLLAAHHIKYYLKVKNPFSQGADRGRMGSLGINMDAAYEYTFYVHKKDYELAQAVLAGRIETK